MVLSNKKLKQNLRAALVESLATKESTNQDEKSESKSFKDLLSSATQKSILSKREKRRKIRSLKGPKAVEGSNGETPEENKETNGSVVLDDDKKKKKNKNKNKNKKRKREDDGGDQERENGVSESKEGEKPLKKSNKKKLKEKKKKKKKNKNKGVEPANEEVKEEPKEEPVEVIESQENADVATKIYVGGIPYYSTEDDIRSFFEGCGTITEIDCMRFPESGKFRGIAMITFKTDAAAKRALAFDGADMGGLFLKIQPYKTTQPQKSSDFAPEIVKGYNRVYAGNLSWDITEEDLRKLFSGCKISSIRFGEDKATGEFRGYAHVDFSDHLSLTMALTLDEKVVCGRPVRIRCAVPKKEPENHSIDKKFENISLGSGGGKKRRTCYECGVPGHLSSACPKKKAVES